MPAVARALVLTPVLIAVLGVSGSARAAAPGWSTPKVATAEKVSEYAAGPGGQSVELFAAPGSVQTRTAQMRAITSSAGEGTAVAVNPAGPVGVGETAVDVNASGRLVAAWALDAQQQGPIGLAAALGARSALPRSATVLPTTGSVTSLDAEIAVDATATVGWIEAAGSGASVRAATMRPGQPPQVATLASSTTPLGSLAVGLDGSGKPTVTWMATDGNGPTSIGVARGDGNGGFAAATTQPLTGVPLSQIAVFVQAGGALTAMWNEGPQPAGPLTVRVAIAPAGGPFGAPRTLATAAAASGTAFAVGADGRAAVLYAVPSGSGVSARAVLRSTSGTWGQTRAIGPSGARRIGGLSAGVDAQGRAVALWSDASPSSSAATRILTARTSSAGDPLGAYHQVTQRSGDTGCTLPQLILSTSGDGLGSWLCNAGASARSQPRLARLTKAS